VSMNDTISSFWSWSTDGDIVDRVHAVIACYHLYTIPPYFESFYYRYSSVCVDIWNSAVERLKVVNSIPPLHFVSCTRNRFSVKSWFHIEYM
jgi:hypothetical protein